ncbi:MAG: hypothetical protein AB2A00_23185 [Myxococcota bacterium]
MLPSDMVAGIAELVGTEELTLEISGRVPEDEARKRVPSELPLEIHDGGVSVMVLLFSMRGLHARLTLLPRFNYGEALWRIGVRFHDEPAWFSPACDIDNPLIRAMGARVVRYPVREARIVLREARGVHAHVDTAEGALTASATPLTGSLPPTHPRPQLVGSSGNLFRIPWGEEPAPFRRHATVSVGDASLAVRTLGGPIRWDAVGVIHKGRMHHCGPARRVSP